MITIYLLFTIDNYFIFIYFVTAKIVEIDKKQKNFMLKK